ncbi:mammalian cell entry protein [Mycobacterium paraense]|uniref:Mammalian cell entry protein n=1 Tax=Mycobacterium paraense TaxID=767916 RepID=A0A1X2A3K8_9MYCO|nr:MCE family protein [Mycobacterium paraense]MCV7441057.1 MCE family protein [Mycobacterium paraense]ORW26972.1 mammalian cell entry protein [Mycobacterium paraense]ORW36726.1 mammalian cell entry protein [Mycobacterium paraense]ORW45297.1 mammalian cell entry protein [Mycobacterium paraense]ORW49393.1 mammalian cell entry protein [Mycobacterium paraense]
MNKYRGAALIKAGFIGAVLIALIIAVGLNPDQLVQRATTVRYQAVFSDAGGLATGNDVTVSGIKVGSVTGMSLQHGDVLVTFTAKGNILLGSATTAHIRTGSLLGQRILTVDSAGSGTLHPMSVIPASRTSSPYSLSEAVENLSSDIQGTDTASLNQSLDTLSATLNQVAPQLGPAFDGITRLSQTLNARNQTLGQLLKGAADVTGILSQRSQQLNTLILNANDLLSMLVTRRQAIVRLLASTSAVSKQLTGIVHDNEAKLAPALEKINSVTAMLEKNRDNIAKALPGLAKYELTQGETVSSGFYYNPFIPNLFQLEFFQWLFDYAFGFRAYGAPGQPPDTAGPRAFFPWPFNMDPGGRP